MSFVWHLRGGETIEMVHLEALNVVWHLRGGNTIELVYLEALNVVYVVYVVNVVYGSSCEHYM